VKTKEFNYHLPRELIAQTPLPVRHASRLLVFERTTGEINHSKFSEIQQFLRKGDLLVINKTRVLPGRLFAWKDTGGKVEVLLLKRINDTRWEVLVGGKRIQQGKRLTFPQNIHGEIVEELEGSKRIIEFDQPLGNVLDKIGEMPLPPYIHERLQDPERYQTVFSDQLGSAAAPTAGLHFTKELMEELNNQDIDFAEITLHVGLDTFAPVTEEIVEEHRIHTEWCQIDEANAEKINHAKLKGNRVIAVGTTSVRTLESAAYDGGVKPISGPTSLFIYPGYHFKVVDCMVTNFHLPKSSLLMLVSAFMGRENVMRCYEEAIREHYRFYSFGDAMLII
jgi:S-adenosylmethionine:tRNA ribosyltransferase-isomerase